MRRAQALLTAGALALAIGCRGSKQHPDNTPRPAPPASHTDRAKIGAAALARHPRPALPRLGAGEAYLYDDKTNAATKLTDAQARAAGLLVVDLGDGWAPFIFQDGGAQQGDPYRPNGYRQTFIDLANDRVDADGHAIAAGEHNFLEPFGIPPTLSVLRARIEDDLSSPRVDCEARVDVEGLSSFAGNMGYVDRDRARRDHAEATRDADWLANEIARRELAARVLDANSVDASVPDAAPTVPAATWKPGDRAAAITALGGDMNARVSARVARAVHGLQRLRAVRAAQARLACEGLLPPHVRFVSGMFDLATHEALASWERKNDVFGWAFLGGETLSTLSRPPLDLDWETFRRVLAERVADAAGIVEDGSAARWKPQSGGAGPVRNLIDEHVTAVLASVHVATPADMAPFLRQHGPDGLTTLRVAFRAPALPAYYGVQMDVSVEIDRGDVWYDFPFDARGRPIEQPREHFPHLTVFVSWQGQRIPLCQWRTTVGSWRSELHENGKIYYKYKNSDVGARVWKQIVAGPVWIPPDATPAKDLLTRKVLDREKGPELVVNTDVMGPGFQSAYGLVMAIHTNRDGFDNQIRTHGSVDYTSIARRFSHGCHRLVNDRAVRLFDFVLRHQPFRRIGSVPLQVKRQFTVDGKAYAFELKTRGYYFDLSRPIPILVIEGRVMGRVKAPITSYVRKAGVDYSDVVERGGTGVASDAKRNTAARPPGSASPSDGDVATSATSIGGSSESPPPAPEEPEPAIGP